MRFRFESHWQVAAPVAEVHRVLADVADYPLWWPQVRAVVQVSDKTGLAECRSLAPFTLRLSLTEQVNLPDLLRVAIEGDLDGWCEFRLAPLPDAKDRTDLAFSQEVEVVRPLLRVMAGPARPLLRGNHAWMMRGCRRGLARQLAQTEPTQTEPAQSEPTQESAATAAS